jgi:hypothetical protein
LSDRGHQACHGVVEGEDVLLAVGAGAGDLDVQRAGDEAADVEEGQAALVLLVGLGGLADDDGVEHDEGVGAGVGRDHDRGGAADAGLRGGYAHALAEDVLLPGPLQGGEQPGDDRARLAFLVGEPERDGWLVQDRVAVLDDAGCLHPVCRSAQFGVLLGVVGPAAEPPFEPVTGAHWRVAGCPGEYGLAAAVGAGRGGAQRDGLGGGGGLGAQTTGPSAAGNTRLTDRRLVGSRTARWNHGPHRPSSTV